MYNKYEKLMKKCISLAKKGRGEVSPNPMVGAVIFDDDFNIISQGYHQKYGGNHAERNAILNAQCDLKGKSIAVNLEPCSHFGKTPPCCDLIIEKGLKRVIIGMVDPNPIVKGNGIKKLQNNNIEVIIGVLEEECKHLNEVFIKNQTQNLPFVLLKTATTLDGKIASSIGDSKWITDDTSRKEVHKLRNSYNAILTSSNTVIKDNPLLTCRIKNGRNPIRIVLDTNLKTSPQSLVYQDDGTKVIVICAENINNDKIKSFTQNVKFLKCSLKNNHIDLKQALTMLYKEGITDILVESGAKLNNSFIQEGLADKFVQFIAPKILCDHEGLSFSEGCKREYISCCNNLKILSTKKLKRDIIIIGEFL